MRLAGAPMKPRTRRCPKAHLVRRCPGNPFWYCECHQYDTMIPVKGTGRVQVKTKKTKRSKA